MIVIAENGYYRNKTSTIAEVKVSSMWSLWTLGLQKWSSMMAAFTRKQLRAIVTTAIAIAGCCNHLGLWTFISVGSDSYRLRHFAMPPHKHWFPREMTTEKRAQKFHTDDATRPRSG